MNTVYALAWKATQQLCGSMDLETAMTAFFQALRSSMPLRHIVLGRFDEAAGTLFAICRTSDQGTVRIFHSFPLTDEQLALARSLRFFDPHEAMDALIDNERHPLAPCTDTARAPTDTRATPSTPTGWPTTTNCTAAPPSTSSRGASSRPPCSRSSTRWLPR